MCACAAMKAELPATIARGEQLQGECGRRGDTARRRCCSGCWRWRRRTRLGAPDALVDPLLVPPEPPEPPPLEPPQPHAAPPGRLAVFTGVEHPTVLRSSPPRGKIHSRAGPKLWANLK